MNRITRSVWWVVAVIAIVILALGFMEARYGDPRLNDVEEINWSCRTDGECEAEADARVRGEQFIFPNHDIRVDCDHPMVWCDDEGA